MNKKIKQKRFGERVQLKCPVEKKIRYATYGGATAASALQGEKHEIEMRAYYCKHCRGYHLTTQPPL